MRARRFPLHASSQVASCQRSASLYSFLHCSATSGTERRGSAERQQGGGVTWRPLFSFACHRCRAECTRAREEGKGSRWTLQLLLRATSPDPCNIHTCGALCASGANELVVGGISAPDTCARKSPPLGQSVLVLIIYLFHEPASTSLHPLSPQRARGI